jgi:hypothetical protein
MAKTKIETGFRILWGAGAADLTGDLIPGTCTGGGKVLDEVDMTGVSETVRNYLAGHASAPISANFHLNDTATTGAYTILRDVRGTAAALALEWGIGGAAPTGGDPKWSGTYLFLGFNISYDAGRAIMICTWRPGSATAPLWGTV